MTATLTPSAESYKVGDAVLFTADGFADDSVITFNIDSVGFSSQVVADAAGSAGTTDVADHATTVLTSSGVNVTAGDTVRLGAVTYTFRAAPSVANDVKIGADAATTLANLKAAINGSGTPGTEYATGTVANPTVFATDLTDTTLKVHARVGGTAGNATVSTETAATLSFPGATFNSGTPGSASTGLEAITWHPISPGTFVVTATDGTTTASCIVRVWSR